MKPAAAQRLEDIPNIGRAIASDLHTLGIHSPDQLAKRDPLATYLALADGMGRRHDPCVLYTLLAARHYLESGESIPWWQFTAQGRQLLAAQENRHHVQQSHLQLPRRAGRQQ
ncbi:MAG TPA: helix-hairpin-helix domain-containing protein [Sideroxyarcus sp.]|nr:helix-hairpin-helix domain-containing protein [Sideroxyarcus sp.]